MELGGLELGGEALDRADGEMKKSEELLGKRAGRETTLDWTGLYLAGLESNSLSFSNPMFNIEPPANLYSEEPTKDITFGVVNPTYVALTEINSSDKGDGLTLESSHHYEEIHIPGEETKTEERSGETESGESESEIVGEVISLSHVTNSGEAGGELLSRNINKETVDVVANNSTNEISEKKTGDNETLVQLSDIFENPEKKEEQTSEEISDVDNVMEKIEE